MSAHPEMRDVLSVREKIVARARQVSQKKQRRNRGAGAIPRNDRETRTIRRYRLAKDAPSPPRATEMPSSGMTADLAHRPKSPLVPLSSRPATTGPVIEHQNLRQMQNGDGSGARGAGSSVGEAATQFTQANVADDSRKIGIVDRLPDTLIRTAAVWQTQTAVQFQVNGCPPQAIVMYDRGGAGTPAVVVTAKYIYRHQYDHRGNCASPRFLSGCSLDAVRIASGDLLDVVRPFYGFSQRKNQSFFKKLRKRSF